MITDETLCPHNEETKAIDCPLCKSKRVRSKRGFDTIADLITKRIADKGPQTAKELIEYVYGYTFSGANNRLDRSMYNRLYYHTSMMRKAGLITTTKIAGGNGCVVAYMLVMT